jgi:thiol-disulfide isomerase/thioredoxin
MTGSPPGARRRTLIVIAAIAALQALAVIAYLQIERGRQERERAAFVFERVGSAPSLPDIALLRADGTSLRASELRGRPVLLHFWATWCAPCRAELPSLLELARDEPELRVIALSLDGDWPVVREFFSGAVPPEVLRDPTGSLVGAYGVSALPDSYLIARDGRALLRFAGARAWDADVARELLAPHVQR